jgi:ABC-type multidrug transport system fused ATPase/permease subunit
MLACNLRFPLNYLSRVALARAVYAPAKYVLLDDPLSAVVSRMGKS